MSMVLVGAVAVIVFLIVSMDILDEWEHKTTMRKDTFRFLERHVGNTLSREVVSDIRPSYVLLKDDKVMLMLSSYDGMVQVCDYQTKLVTFSNGLSIEENNEIIAVYASMVVIAVNDAPDWDEMMSREELVMCDECGKPVDGYMPDYSTVCSDCYYKVPAEQAKEICWNCKSPIEKRIVGDNICQSCYDELQGQTEPCECNAPVAVIDTVSITSCVKCTECGKEWWQ